MIVQHSFGKYPEERKAVLALTLKGKTIRDISDRLGLPFQRTKTHVNALLRQGLIPSAVTRKNACRFTEAELFLRNESTRRQVRYGQIIDILLGLHVNQINWLLDQIPKNGSLSDVLRAIIVDAYEEEQHAT
jgi:predicted ArsR family transcriptional regulator